MNKQQEPLYMHTSTKISMTKEMWKNNCKYFGFDDVDEAITSKIIIPTLFDPRALVDIIRSVQ